MAREIVSGIFIGLVCIVLFVTTGSLVAQHVVHSEHGHEHAAAKAHPGK